jgi:hypothetical protein
MVFEAKEKKAIELIQKSIADLNSASRDIDELDMIFRQSQYALTSEIKADLQHARQKIDELKGKIQFLQLQNIIGYGIWYSDNISSYPAAGKFNVQTYYKNVNEAKSVASRLAQQNHGITFGVYPYNGNYNIAGKAVSYAKVL